MRYLLTVAYDGTAYGGWQRQKNAVTVQEKMEEALGAVFRRQVKTVAASRTDAGVHALGQRVCFSVPECRIPPGKLPLVLNNCLPSDISVTLAEETDECFNPRFRAKEKTYRYQLWNGKCPNPLIRRTSHFFPYALDLGLMAEASQAFVGRHDFAAFCASGSSVATTVRGVFECAVASDGGMVTIIVRGDGFLYNMVRIISGTLVGVGQGKIAASAVPSIIASRSRPNAGKTMPPEGLTLINIKY